MKHSVLLIVTYKVQPRPGSKRLFHYLVMDDDMQLQQPDLAIVKNTQVNIKLMPKFNRLLHIRSLRFFAHFQPSNSTSGSSSTRSRKAPATKMQKCLEVLRCVTRRSQICLPTAQIFDSCGFLRYLRNKNIKQSSSKNLSSCNKNKIGSLQMKVFRN